jgi:ribosomal protein S18 acetylase RimI-like enzyme
MAFALRKRAVEPDSVPLRGRTRRSEGAALTSTPYPNTPDTGAVMRIRAARLEDEDALARVDAATWTTDVSAAPPPRGGARFFGRQARPQDVLVAESEAVIGDAKLTQPITLASHQHVLELGGLAVDPGRQRAGAGRRLVEAIADLARSRGARKLSLRVLAPNTAARELYQRAGSRSRAPCERSSNSTDGTSTMS